MVKGFLPVCLSPQALGLTPIAGDNSKSFMEITPKAMEIEYIKNSNT